MVSYALNFHPVKGQSDLAKKIRSLAVQRGGFELVTAPTSEVVHDADNMMRQHFENGWMWEGDKNTGVLELKRRERRCGGTHRARRVYRHQDRAGEGGSHVLRHYVRREPQEGKQR